VAYSIEASGPHGPGYGLAGSPVSCPSSRPAGRPTPAPCTASLVDKTAVPINKQYIHNKQHYYESWSMTTRVGRWINMLQNHIILLLFKIWKFGNIRFVRNLIGHIHWNLCGDDVGHLYLVSAVVCPAVFFYNSPSVKLPSECELREKWTSSTSKHV